MSENTFDQELDCRGLLCPLPIVKTKQVIDTLSPGQVLKMQATDRGSVLDVQAWTRQTGHELVNSDEQDGVFTYYLRKK
jgi:TusA-related sulfurtransferase